MVVMVVVVEEGEDEEELKAKNGFTRVIIILSGRFHVGTLGRT